MALAMTFFSCIYRKYLENDNSPSVSINRLGYFGRNLMFLWSHLTNHCKHFNQIVINLNLKFPISHFSAYFIRLNSRRAIRIVVGVWCLITVVLANAYAGTLLSFLSIKKLGPVINSLDELAQSQTCKLIILAGSEPSNQFLVNYKAHLNRLNIL